MREPGIQLNLDYEAPGFPASIGLAAVPCTIHVVDPPDSDDSLQRNPVDGIRVLALKQPVDQDGCNTPPATGSRSDPAARHVRQMGLATSACHTPQVCSVVAHLNPVH
jgi:hypothetical protein